MGYEFVVYGCKLCPHQTTEKSYMDDYCDCEGNCCDEGCIPLKWDEETEQWVSDDKEIILYRY